MTDDGSIVSIVCNAGFITSPGKKNILMDAAK